MKNNKNISIKDIANLSGVSIATVSRIINNTGRYSQKTKEKVLSIIEKYGYTTNMAAKSLRMAKSKTIGLIVPRIDNEWFSNLILEIENNCFKNNYSVFICNSSENKEKEISYFKSLDAKLVDGIICISGIEEIPSNIIKRDIPLICIDRKPKNQEKIYYVESDHFNGGYLATEELIKNGCKKIAIIYKNSSLSVNKQRLNGYLAALKKYNIEPNNDLQIMFNKKESNFEGSRKAINKLINKKIKFDGIFATNDWRAYGALTALIDNNIKVPDQVKVIGFDDIPISKYCSCPLSTIKQNIPLLAKTATSVLISLIEEKNSISPDTFKIPVELITRESTKQK